MQISNLNSLKGGFIIIATLILINACSDSAGSKYGSQFRGPDANMIVSGENLPSQWGEDLNVAWTFDVEGEGWASPVVWGNQVFVASTVPFKINKPGEGEGEEENQDLYLKDVYRWELICVDIESGKELWKQVAHEGSPRIKKHARTNYASETPVTDGKRVYVYFGMTGLFCYDMEGTLVWEKDLDAKNGEEIWRVERDELTNYGTPYLWKNSVRTELVVGGKKARAYDPATGELLWELQMDGHYNIPSPTADQNLIFMGNAGYRDVKGTYFAIKAGSEGDITPDSGQHTSAGVAWSNSDAAFLGSPSPLLYDRFWASVAVAGDAYLFKGDKKLYCIRK